MTEIIAPRPASFISRFTLLQFTNLKKHEKAMPFGV